jgi:hypothetical protein
MRVRKAQDPICLNPRSEEDTSRHYYKTQHNHLQMMRRKVWDEGMYKWTRVRLKASSSRGLKVKQMGEGTKERQKVQDRRHGFVAIATLLTCDI